MRTARAAALLAAAVVIGGLVRHAVGPVAPITVHVSGDGAVQVAAQVFDGADHVRTDDPHRATVQIVTFRRWQNLEGLSDVMALCGRACDGGADVVVLRRPAINGATRIVLIDLGAMGGGAALDVGRPLPPATLDCAMRAIEGAGSCDGISRKAAWRPRLWSPKPGRS
ncbi:hypothetical protein [Jannaschia rubra]|uniref:hypothetical protein n=1 Tax=Jannaschia rubra TaxID=282197 RepID=UPI0024933D70|nr:hypothetical protein [Jannaschia rubra]